MKVWKILRLHPEERVQRQPVADRRIAGDQVAALAAQEPRTASPAVALVRARDRQHVAHRLVELALENPRQARALQRIGEFGAQRIDVAGELALPPGVIEDILIGGKHVLRRHAERDGDRRQQSRRIRAGLGVPSLLVRDERPLRPDGLAVSAPEAIQRPPRQLLARIPFALSEMGEARGSVALLEFPIKLRGDAPLVLAQRLGVPLRSRGVLARHERGLASHGEPHVGSGQILVDALAQCIDGGPLRLRIGLGDARRLPDALDTHGVLERRLTGVDRTGQWRGGSRIRRAGEGNVSLAREQPRGGVESDPSGARQVHLAPGVKVREIPARTGGPHEGLVIGHELNQVAGHEARGEAQVPQQLHQKLGRIPAGAGSLLERHFGRLHARLHADQVLHVARQAPVELDQEIGRGSRLPRDARKILGEQGRRGARQQERHELALFRGLVLERESLRVRLQEEVERIDHRHFGGQIHLDAQLPRELREDQPRQVVRLRILLPVDEMLRGIDLQRIGKDSRAAMGRRPQPYDLRPERYRPVVPVMHQMVERYVNGHRTGSEGIAPTYSTRITGKGTPQAAEAFASRCALMVS